MLHAEALHGAPSEAMPYGITESYPRDKQRACRFSTSRWIACQAASQNGGILMQRHEEFGISAQAVAKRALVTTEVCGVQIEAEEQQTQDFLHTAASCAMRGCRPEW